jgi:hypothetical protein
MPYGRDFNHDGYPIRMAEMLATLEGNELDGCFKIGHMELMINALGLGACLMGFGTFAFAMSQELKQRVGIQEGESVIFTLVFGHPHVRYLRTVNRKKVKFGKI